MEQKNESPHIDGADLALTVCRNLRNKKMSYLPLVEALVSGRVGAEGNSLGHGAHHWCFLTQRPVGPDEGFVSTDQCVPGRGCHCPL